MYHESKDGSGQLKRIPGSREDVFADKSIDLKSKRALMKFLKFITDIEAYGQAMGTWADKPFDDFLTQEFNISADLQPTLHALTLSPQNPHQTKTIYALPRILRHLSSIGVFGPGFGSVIPKWGGLAEITQVACRACAVGGGIYMLDKGVSAINNGVEDLVNIKLDDEQEVRSKLIAGRKEDLIANPSNSDLMITRSISIVDSTLDQLFPIIADGSPPAACSITVFSSGSLFIEDISSTVPVYLAIHTSETGECPAGQCKLISICIKNLHDDWKI